MKMLVFFLQNVFGPRKNHGCGQKKPKALALLYLASKPLRKLQTQAVCRPSSQQNWQGKCELFAWALSPYFFRLHWTFSLPPKRQLSILWNFFFPLTNLFLTFVVFACLLQCGSPCDFAPKTRDSAQGYIQCMPLHIGDPVMQTDGWTDELTDGRSRVYYVTTKICWLDRLPNFLSNGAPLMR